MVREDLRRFLLAEIKRAEGKKKNLVRQKADADGPRTSWSSTLHLDIESDLDQVRGYIARCRAVLGCLDKSVPSEVIGIGSIVNLSIKKDVVEYILVEDGGGAIGDCQILSAKSPIGKAILEKQEGEEVAVTVPEGAVLVTILAVV